MQRESALSPTCEFNFFAARARGMKIAASAQLRMLLCGGETGHSFLPQHKSCEQGSSRGTKQTFIQGLHKAMG